MAECYAEDFGPAAEGEHFKKLVSRSRERNALALPFQWNAVGWIV